jgi:hypothetical protein
MAIDANQAKTAGKLLRGMAAEIETAPPVGKIDWSKIIDLVIQLLPIILAFFQQPEPEKKN